MHFLGLVTSSGLTDQTVYLLIAWPDIRISAETLCTALLPKSPTEDAGKLNREFFT